MADLAQSASSNLTSRIRRRLAALGTVRARSSLAATVVVAVAMGLGSLLLLLVFRRGLVSTLDDTLSSQASDRVALLDVGSLPADLVAPSGRESTVWIGTAEGATLATSADHGILEPGDLPLIPGTHEAELLLSESESEDSDSGPAESHEADGGDASDGGTEVSAMRLAVAEGVDGRFVVVGAELEIVDDPVGQLATLLRLVVPLTSLAVGGLVWLTTGSALRPVERIRRNAERISGRNLDERVPVPDGRDEIGALAETVNDMLGRIDRHDQAMRRFTADASHELKSPVANLAALASTAEIVDPAWPDLRSRLVGETNRIDDLVVNLLFLAQNDDPASPDRPSSVVHLDDLLFDSAEVIAATTGVAVDISNITPASVSGVQSDLGRLVRNITDNATRHAATTVFLASGSDPATAWIEVADDGPGIPEVDRDRVFERFTRLDSARSRDAGGSGLGLAIVAAIASAHDAIVTVAASTSGGAAFRVEFPNPTE